MGIEEPEYVNFNAKMLREKGNDEKLVSLLDKVFATKTREEWMQILRENDCICERIASFDDLLIDPQVLANNYLPEFDHPTYGKTRYAPIPFELSKTPGAIRLAAPQFGQHTEEVLVEILGYTWGDIAGLKQREVI